TFGETDAQGRIQLSGSDVPQSVSFVDPMTGLVRTFAGSVASPLRQVMAVPFPRGPRFQATVQGIPADCDLVVMLNGRVIFEKDAANASESFIIDWNSEDD